jgi:diguanylate cyclase (GGDEF)-like protein
MLEEENARLMALAFLDGLTGLKNHREFLTRLEEEFSCATRYRHPLSLMLLDVDQFKQYNDTFGHPAGDKALCTLVNLLEQSVRASDLAARCGGEEFALLLPNTDSEVVRDCAERVRATVAAFSWPRRPVTISLGIST